MVVWPGVESADSFRRYILQQLFNKKDRQIETDIKENAVYPIFGGRVLLENWHCPDQTKIEAFQSRLSPETYQRLANKIAQVAVDFGFACFDEMDIDSIVQEAHCSYPRDVRLMVKLSAMAHKVDAYLADFWQVNLKGVRAAARQ